MFAKMFDLATSDIGSSNRTYSDNETLAIQSVLRDAEQLLEEPRRLHELIDRCKVALAPHRKLPEDVLRCIFVLHVEPRQEIHIPFKRFSGKLVIPAAMVLTHVCSLWRRIALSSPGLWNNIILEIDNRDRSFLPLALELLSRARDLPMKLDLRVSFYRRGSDDHRFNDFGEMVNQLISSRNLQQLGLYIDGSLLAKFSPKDMFSVGTFDHVRDLNLHLNHNSSLPVFSQSSFPNLEAFFYETTIIGGDLNLPGVPWSQLRRLDLGTYTQDVPTALGLLSQCTMIEECKLFVIISGSAVGPRVTLPNLRHLEFEFMQIDEVFDILDIFFSLLSCPTLQSLVIFEEDFLEADSIPSSSRVMSPLAKNLKLMAPQLQKLLFNLPIDNGEADSLSDQMTSLHIAVVRLR